MDPINALYLIDLHHFWDLQNSTINCKWPNRKNSTKFNLNTKETVISKRLPRSLKSIPFSKRSMKLTRIQALYCLKRKWENCCFVACVSGQVVVLVGLSNEKSEEGEEKRGWARGETLFHRWLIWKGNCWAFSISKALFSAPLSATNRSLDWTWHWFRRCF